MKEKFIKTFKVGSVMNENMFEGMDFDEIKAYMNSKLESLRGLSEEQLMQEFQMSQTEIEEMRKNGTIPKKVLDDRRTEKKLAELGANLPQKKLDNNFLTNLKMRIGNAVKGMGDEEK